MYKSLLKIAVMSMALVCLQPALAGVSSSAEMPEVREIQTEWARLYYLDEFLNANYKELQALARKANKVAHEHPDSAEALVWDAIVLSTLAEKKGGLGALSLVKEAKLKLEQAEGIDPTVLGGSVRYITPSATIGEHSNTPARCSWYIQIGRSEPTLAALIWSSAE